MKCKNLKELNEEIQKKEKCSNSSLPVINELKPPQKYLIMSSDPSSDTDKSKDELERHSGFEERVISLVLFGSDGVDSLEKTRADYRRYKSRFLNNFYWTHYSKCYSKGNPDNFWANKFLKKEISLFEPELIVIFGNKPTDFLFGKGKLKERVNKTHEWQGIPVIHCLYPSRNWNMQRREEYEFVETWALIRSKVQLD